MSAAPHLVSESLDSVLDELVHDALAAQSIATTSSTEAYLSRLLRDYLRVAPETWTRAFGVELLSAASLEPQLRYHKLKELADTTLFLSGIFLDYIEARLAATEYYFRIGSEAYLSLGGLDASGAVGDTYIDLGNRFEDFARALTMVADRELSASKQRVVMLYEKWVRTGHPRYKRRLMSLGVPSEGILPSRTH